MAIRVAFDRCETCIFRMKYPKETRERIFGATLGKDMTFIACHMHSVEDGDGEEQSDVMCRGHWNLDPYGPVRTRVGAMLRAVVFVDESGQELACPWPQG